VIRVKNELMDGVKAWLAENPKVLHRLPTCTYRENIQPFGNI